jgi:hypothetical protein
VQCPHCDLFRHVNKKDCKHKHCINVQVDWLTILLSVSASHTLTELLKASDCTVDPNTLRSGSKFRKFADWEHVKQKCDSIRAEQLLELKRATSDFQKDRIASYKNLYASNRTTGLSHNARYVMQIKSRTNTQTPHTRPSVPSHHNGR